MLNLGVRLGVTVFLSKHTVVCGNIMPLYTVIAEQSGRLSQSSQHFSWVNGLNSASFFKSFPYKSVLFTQKCNHTHSCTENSRKNINIFQKHFVKSQTLPYSSKYLKNFRHQTLLYSNFTTQTTAKHDYNPNKKVLT